MTVFEIIVVIALLIVAVAIVGLFAMMGELSARVGSAPEQNDPHTEPVEGALTGVVPASWPAGIGQFAAAELAAVLVLSPICGACARMAPTVATHSVRDRADLEVGVLVSCSDGESGRDFVRQHNLSGVPYALDVEGAWSSGEFAVTMSPTLLLFERGRLHSASSIASLAGVDVIVRQAKEETDAHTETAAHR